MLKGKGFIVWSSRVSGEVSTEKGMGESKEVV